MATQIVSKLIGQLGSVLTEELTRRGKLVVGAEKDVKKLASTFSSIEALLLDAEERQLTDKAVEDWLTKLKNVCYEIDDALDKWRTEILKRQIEDDNNSDDCCWLEKKLLEISNILKRVCPFLPTYCFSPDEIGVRYDIASVIEELYEKVDQIDKDKNVFGFTAKPAVLYKSLPTSSIIKFSDVKGREEETELLKEKLLQISSDVQSISIQGAGGLGKTTLAKLLYNDKVVGDHFDKRTWVCVSDTFDPTTVAKTIFASLFGCAPEINTLSFMLEKISERTKGMRFLLVLDDVWEDSRSKWEELRNALSCNSPGSKILVTTRKGEVSRALGCIEDDVLLIGKMSEDVCRAIFTQVAFNGWNANEKERVESLCIDAVAKCDGLPLAAKVLGGVMQSKKSKSEWVKVLNSEMWHLEEVRKEVFRPLALSYYDLTPQLRRCFQVCAVFPKDYEMEKDELIKLWISQGFVGASGTQEVEDTGEEYFQILAARSFFQDFRTKKEFYETEKRYCKMHDFVSDFAQMLSKGECVSMTMENRRNVTAVYINDSVVRNLRIDWDSRWSNLTINSSHFFLMKDLRSFMANSFNDMELDVWGHLCGIRSLVLTHSELKKIPSTINQLIHMRHLDLSNNRLLEELCEEICELYNLWTLTINWCYQLKKLPLGMGNKLVNLKHIENERTSAPVPKSIGRLTRLKTLREFRIQKHQAAQGGASIADLKNMNQLQGLLCVCGLSNVAESYEVEQADFARKTALTGLVLEFKDYKGNIGDDKDEELLEAVRPSTNLEELIITRYMGASVSPRWMVSLSNLTRLSLMYCYKVKYLPPLGHLRSLEKLSFLGMIKVKNIGVELLGHDIGAFPRLTVLTFESMWEWEEWDDTMLSSPSVMPRLSYLKLRYCKKLKKLPNAILEKPTLERLEVNDCRSLGNYLALELGLQ